MDYITLNDIASKNAAINRCECGEVGGRVAKKWATNYILTHILTKRPTYLNNNLQTSNM